MAAKRVVIFGWSRSVHVGRWVQGLTRRGYEIKLVSLGGDPLPNVETCILPRGGRWSYFVQAGAAAREARKFKPHLVHVHYAAGFGLWSLRAGFHPTIVSVWGSDIIDFPSNWLRRLLIRRILTKADRITATSQLLKRVTLQLAPTVAGKLNVIPFGVDIPGTVTAPSTEGPIKICYIKVHGRKYGPDVLLKAMTIVKQAIPDIVLTMAGEGEMTEQLKEMSTRLGLDENVRFIGFVDNREIYKLLQEHHFMVMPSVMESESFGVAVLEASACGRAVVASDIGGVPEVMVDGRTGFLVPPGNSEKLAAAIIKLARDADLCKKMGIEGHRFAAENYSWEKSLDMMVELYERVIYESQ